MNSAEVGFIKETQNSVDIGFLDETVNSVEVGFINISTSTFFLSGSMVFEEHEEAVGSG